MSFFCFVDEFCGHERVLNKQGVLYLLFDEKDYSTPRTLSQCFVTESHDLKILFQHGIFSLSFAVFLNWFKSRYPVLDIKIIFMTVNNDIHGMPRRTDYV